MGWKTVIKGALLKRNTILSTPPGQFSITEWKLARMKDRGFIIRVAVDCGAARGGFAMDLKALYPDAKIIMIEPRDDAQMGLKDLVGRVAGLSLVSKLVGPTEGDVEFYQSNEQSSILKDASGKAWGNVTRSPMTTLDRVMQEAQLVPDLIKLDVQGAELQVLSGAVRSLEQAQAVLLEGSLIELQNGMPLLDEVMAFMKEKNFQLYDIFGLWHRPLDGALAQGDFLFLKKGHALLADKRWDALDNHR